MNNKKGKKLLIILIVISLIGININLYAHSGGTDSRGGHKDNKNKSGLGSYHYHCGGYSAHLHPNGICPYTSKSKSTTSTSKKTTSKSSTTKNITTKSTTSSSKSSTNKNTTPKSTTSSSTNVNKESKESKTNSLNKITNSVSENKITTNVINNVVELNEGNKVIEVSAPITNKISNVNAVENALSNSEEELDGAAIVTLGLIGGGAYLIHKKNKNKKNK